MSDVITLKDELGNVVSRIDSAGVKTLSQAPGVPDGSFSQAKLDSTMLRMSTSYFQDGKVTVTVLAANEHPKMRLKSGFVQLIEIADATGTTFTVKVRNATGAVDMTDILTFTQGTEAVADVKAFTVDATNHTATKAQAIEIITAGTTTIAGEVVIHLEWLGVA